MGNMKYVKLFESWLNEAEGEDEGTIKRFNKAEPEEWPVRKTTVAEAYPGGKLNIEVMASVLQRGRQPRSTKGKPAKFQKMPDYTVKPVYATEVKTDGTVKCGYNGQYGNDRYQLAKDFREAAEYFKAAGIRNCKLSENVKVKPLFAFKCYVTGLGDRNDDPETSKVVRTYSSALVFVANDLKAAGVNTSTTNEIINIPCVAVADEKVYSSTIGNVLCYIYTGETDALQQDGEEMMAGVNNIFAGEQAKAQLAYEKTIGTVRFIAASSDQKDQKDKIQDPVIITTPAKGTEYIGQIRFEFDSDKLTEEAKKTLTSDTVENRLGLKAKKSIEIVGNADGMGDAAYNKKLSLRRAESVKKFLESTDWWSDVTGKNVKITVRGDGFDNKIMEDNGGKDAAAATINRRVDLIIDGAKPNYDQIKKDVEAMKSGK